MIKVFKCRRSSLALIGMVLVTALGMVNHIDTSLAIASMAAAVAAANAAQSIKGPTDGK
jgi:hypothetical protein